MAAPVRLSFRSGGLELVAYEWGERGAPPALVLHGGLDHARAWDEVCRLLAVGRRLIALDLRGHGDSGWARDAAYDPTLYMYDIVQVLRALEAGPVALIGHSMGAMLSMRVAAAFPELVSRMLLIEGVIGEGLYRAPSANVDPRMQAWVDARKAAASAGPGMRLRTWIEERDALTAFPSRTYATLDAAAARLLRDNDKRLTPAQAAHIAATGMKPAPGGYEWKFDPMVRARFSCDLTTEESHELWRSLTCPMLHIYGAQSWGHPIDQDQRDCFATAHFAVVEDAGHWVHFNQPERFIALAQEFLAP